MEASLSAEWSPATVDLDGPRMGREPDDESPCSLLIVAKMAQLRIPGLRALDQTHLLAIKLDVADQIAVKICTRQVLEIDFPASNVKIRQQLMTGETF
jgi:hypothetical protein